MIVMFFTMIAFVGILKAVRDSVDDRPERFEGSWWAKTDTNSFGRFKRWNPFRDGWHAADWLLWVIALGIIPALALNLPVNTNWIALMFINSVVFTMFFFYFYHIVFK